MRFRISEGRREEGVGGIRRASSCHDLSCARLDDQQPRIEKRLSAWKSSQPCVCHGVIFPVSQVCASFVFWELLCLILFAVVRG